MHDNYHLLIKNIHTSLKLICVYYCRWLCYWLLVQIAEYIIRSAFLQSLYRGYSALVNSQIVLSSNQLKRRRILHQGCFNGKGSEGTSNLRGTARPFNNLLMIETVSMPMLRWTLLRMERRSGATPSVMTQNVTSK